MISQIGQDSLVLDSLSLVCLTLMMNLLQKSKSGHRFGEKLQRVIPRHRSRESPNVFVDKLKFVEKRISFVSLYCQMPNVKYACSLGSTTKQGGAISTSSYSTVRGVDKLIPVDVYLPGCPPKPEAVIDAITKLRKKISREIYEDRIRSQQANRCFTTNHKFRTGRSMNNGNYDQRFLYQPPSTSEIPTETFFKYQSSVSSHELVN
uniref:NADH-plastoquinone oxidoreductase subunit K n=1 Tax=Pedicularis oederi TaxID=326839 RepID=A0A6G7SE93_PEDOE|nr:NADH-plastoquinone oxidoreductase subunit K [Pedicularis oederi]QIK00003.1 NADH-plastoquinone oxidoreductase subunit K [Pedicularis oederi]